MKRFLPVLALLAASGAAHAQAARNEATAGAGVLSGEVTYARRVGTGPLSVGVGAWGAWEPPTTFGRDVWEPLGVSLFARIRPAPWVHLDAGPTAARYLRADDCSDTCGGSFVGVRAVAMVGRRWLFVGPEVAVGRASDERNGAEIGAIFGAQARVVLGWGK